MQITLFQWKPKTGNFQRFYAKDGNKDLGYIQLTLVEDKILGFKSVHTSFSSGITLKIFEMAEKSGLDLHAFCMKYCSNAKAYSFDGKKGKTEKLNLEE